MLKQTEDDEKTLFRGEKLIWERKDVNSSYHCNFLRVRKIKIEFDGDSLKSGGKKKHNINNNLAFLPTWRISFWFLSCECFMTLRRFGATCNPRLAAQATERWRGFFSATNTVRSIALLPGKAFEVREKFSLCRHFVNTTKNKKHKNRYKTRSNREVR